MSEGTRERRWALALCFLTGLFEGLDLQALGVAAPAVVAELKLLPAQLGYVGSASSLGLFLGAMTGGMLADRIGRRAVLLGAVLMFGVFSILTPLASDSSSLTALRALTGLGLGAGLPMIIAIAAEASSPERRSGTVTMMYSSTPVGGVIASGLAYFLAEDWRMIFYIGGLAPLMLVPLLYWRLRDATGVAATAVPVRGGRSVAVALFGEGRAGATLLLWVGFLGSLLVLYLLLNWLPVLLVSKGFSRSDASAVQVAFNVGGALGALGLGWAIDRINRRIVLALAFAAAGAAIAALAVVQDGHPVVLGAGLIAGVFANGSTFLIYGLAPGYYSTPIRGTGVGWAVAVGRFGSILGPLLAGILLGAGRSSDQVLLSILPIVLITALAAQFLLFRRAEA